MQESIQQPLGPVVSDLRSLLGVFGTAHPATRQWESPTKAGQTWLNIDAKNAVVNALSSEGRKFSVSVSAGKGDASETPWIAVMRPEITTSPQSGVYVVYLFCPDRKRIVLCIMLGVTRPGSEAALRRAPSTRDAPLLKDLAARLRQLISPPSRFPETSLSVGGRTPRSLQYNVGFIFGRTYDVSVLPDNEVLVQDLHHLLTIYGDLTPADINSVNVAPGPAQRRVIDTTRSRRPAVASEEPLDLEAALQRRERATKEHEAIVQRISALVARSAYPPAEETKHIDVLICGKTLIEVKSLQRDDPQQVRDAVAQLLYYRFLYRDEIKDPHLVLALGRKPGKALDHLVAFAEDCGIQVIWHVRGFFEGPRPLLDGLAPLGRILPDT